MVCEVVFWTLRPSTVVSALQLYNETLFCQPLVSLVATMALISILISFVVAATSLTTRTISTGHTFAEGPSWSTTDGVLYFSDAGAKELWRWTASSGVAEELFSRPTNGVIGTHVAGAGTVWFASAVGVETINVTSGVWSTLATSPLPNANDLAVQNDGSLYFSVPEYDAIYFQTPGASPGVFYSATTPPSSWNSANSFLNGVALSPDEGTLYQSDSTTGWVVAFDTKSASGATLSKGTNRRNFANAGSGADGMAVHSTSGWLFVATNAGVRIYDDQGALKQSISVPGNKATNVALGSRGGFEYLYVTLPSSVIEVELTTAYIGPPLAGYNGGQAPSPPDGGAPSPPDDGGASLAVGAIVGIAVGGGVGLLVAAVLMCYCRKKRASA